MGEVVEFPSPQNGIRVYCTECDGSINRPSLATPPLRRCPHCGKACGWSTIPRSVFSLTGVVSPIEHT